MEENKIRIKRAEEDLYKINIDDDGTEIVFDLADISLPVRCDKAFREVESNKNRALSQIKVIENKYVNQNMNKKLESQKTSEVLKVYQDMFAKNRVIMDEFFGLKGAMQHLFGDSNYLDMYSDLFEQFKPHFEKMQLNAEAIKERISKKYGTSDNVIK